MRKLLLAGLLVSCLSCQTIHYTNDSTVPHEYTYSKWRHSLFFGLLEISEPLELSRICPKNNWKAVRTRTGLLQGLVRYLQVQLTSHVLNYTGIAVYTPEEVSVICKK